MTDTYWRVPFSGNWDNAAFWSDGVPTSTVDAHLELGYGLYTVTVSAAEIADSVIVNDPGATLSETGGGALTLDILRLHAGTVVLRNANTIDDFTMDGGTAEIANANALGTDALGMAGGALVAIANLSLNNPLQLSGLTEIAAAHARALTLKGSWSLDASVGATLTFGDSSNDGLIRLMGADAGITDPGNYTVHVGGGTLLAAGAGFTDLMASAENDVVDAGATLDWNGHDGTLVDPTGAGTITNSAAHDTAHAAIDLGGGTDTFDGNFTGNLVLDLQNGTLTLTGGNTVTTETHIDPGATLIYGGTGATMAGFDIDDEGSFEIDRATDATLTTALSGGGSFAAILSGGAMLTIDENNSIVGPVNVVGGRLSIDRVAAIGTGTLGLDSATLIATQDVTLVNGLTTYNTFDTPLGFAAAAGKTLEIAPASGWLVELGPGNAIHFGLAGDTGTVLWDKSAGDNMSPGYDVDVDFGTLKAGNTDGLANLVDFAAHVTLAAGTTLSLGGSSVIIKDLEGAGNIANTGSSTTLVIQAGNFAGKISGPVKINTQSSVALTGDNTNNGVTTIANFCVLTLGAGGNTGSVKGAIKNGGTLIIDHADTFNLGNAVSGSGGFIQAGDGVTTIDRAESFSGGVTVTAGELSIDRAGAIGAGELTLAGGEFLATKSMTLANDLEFLGTTTVSATHGKTLTFDGAAAAHISTGQTVSIGDAAHDGTVVFAFSNGTAPAGDYDIKVNAGTLAAGGLETNIVMGAAASTTVAAGASIDATSDLEIAGLHGAGHVSGAAGVNVFLDHGADFAGTFDSDLKLTIDGGTVTLSGGGTFANSVNLQQDAVLVLQNAAHENVDFVAVDTTLVLDDPGLYDGQIVDFGEHSGNAIDLPDIDFAAGVTLKYKASSRTLTVSDGTHTDHVHFSGIYTVHNFMTVADSGTGTDILFVA